MYVCNSIKLYNNKKFSQKLSSRARQVNSVKQSWTQRSLEITSILRLQNSSNTLSWVRMDTEQVGLDALTSAKCNARGVVLWIISSLSWRRRNAGDDLGPWITVCIWSLYLMALTAAIITVEVYSTLREGQGINKALPAKGLQLRLRAAGHRLRWS